MDFKYKEFFLRLYNKSFEEDIFNNAAQVAFYFSFAIFPLLLFLVTLFGFFLDSADQFRTDLYFYLRQIMPFSAYELVQKTIEEITENSTSGKLTIGILIALWSASSGVDSLRNGLNAVYKCKESRSWFATKALSLLLTFLLTVLITTALGIIFYGWQFISFIFAMLSLPVPSPSILIILQWAITLLVLLLIFEVFFSILPDRVPRRWFWITPGAVVSIALWLLVSSGFRTYLSYFNTYDKFYGSIGAVIILMLWLYLTSSAILVGGSINAVLQEMRTEKSDESIIKEVIEAIELDKEIEETTELET